MAVCGKTPDPYANAYLTGARNCQMMSRKASLNSLFISICWLTPKFVEGNSEKACMLKSGFSSQSGGKVFGRFDDFCAGLGDRPGTDGEKGFAGEDGGLDTGVLPDDSLRSEELSELVDAHRW